MPFLSRHMVKMLENSASLLLILEKVLSTPTALDNCVQAQASPDRVQERDDQKHRLHNCPRGPGELPPWRAALAWKAQKEASSKSPGFRILVPGATKLSDLGQLLVCKMVFISLPLVLLSVQL